MLKLNFKDIKKILIASTSIFSFSISFNALNLSGLAQNNDPRWYATLSCELHPGFAGAKVSQLVVDTYIDPVDIPDAGFVAHPLWFNINTGAWVEVGYDKEPIRSNETLSYWASYTSTTETYRPIATATIGTYKELKIIWNRNTNKWEMSFGGQKIGEAANIGGPTNDTKFTEAGLETTSDKNSSPKAPVYNLQYFTLNNLTWNNCSNPSLYQDNPAKTYWVNQPFSAETRMP